MSRKNFDRFVLSSVGVYHKHIEIWWERTTPKIDRCTYSKFWSELDSRSFYDLLLATPSYLCIQPCWLITYVLLYSESRSNRSRRQIMRKLAMQNSNQLGGGGYAGSSSISVGPVFFCILMRHQKKRGIINKVCTPLAFLLLSHICLSVCHKNARAWRVCVKYSFEFVTFFMLTC